MRWYENGVVTREMAGEWLFARVLEGRAIQDLWIVPPRSEREADLYEYGTSIRFYDPASRKWRSTWIGPMNGMVRTFLAERHGDDIVLASESAAEGALRRVFSDISAQNFSWHNYVQKFGAWQLQQDFVCTRKA